MSLRHPLAVYRQRRLRLDLARQVAAVETFLRGRAPGPADRQGPVVFFNASTRIHTLSLNGAFALLASWAVRAAGHPVRHLVCHAGLAPCVLGTDRRRPESDPPCGPCFELSRTLYPPELIQPVTLGAAANSEVRQQLSRLSLPELIAWEADRLPLGALTLPSLRWILRRHHLPDSEPVRRLFAGYLESATALAQTVRMFLENQRPRALVVFNGVFYPEAVARRVAQDLGIRVVTHEVGLRPFSAFFSHDEATFREVEIPRGAALSAAQNARLDEALARRFRGEFTMAGIRFWPEMSALPPSLTEKRRGFRQVVSVLTNVVFDTSQVHANMVFDDMFDWLSDLAGVMRGRTDTLFVIRAHPDETRRGKESQQSVAAWVRDTRLTDLGNVVFFGPEERVSTYDLIRASKFVLVYNSSVGVEASILGTPALCAGRARFTRSQAAYTPADRAAYGRTLQTFLTGGELEVPEAQVRRARAFMYHELFSASLDLGEFLTPDRRWPGMVRFAAFAPSRLAAAEPCQVIREGIVRGRPFLLRNTIDGRGARRLPSTSSSTRGRG